MFVQVWRPNVVSASYNVSERVRFDGILSGQRYATEDDEDEDEVGEVRVMDEVVAGDSQTENGRTRETHEIDLSESVGTEVRMIHLRLPVFLSKNEEGASVRDRDDFFFGP